MAPDILAPADEASCGNSRALILPISTNVPQTSLTDDLFDGFDPKTPMGAATRQVSEQVEWALGGGQAGLCSTFWNTTALSLGIGLLTLPDATMRAGYGASFATLVFIGLLSFASVQGTVLARRRARELTQTRDISLVETARVHLGPRWRDATAASICLAQMGTCIGYEIFISSTLEKHFPYLSFLGWLIIVQAPLLIFSAVRSMRLLAFVSSVCVLAVVCGLSLASVLMGQQGVHHGWANMHVVTNVEGCIFLFGVTALAFGGVGAVGLNVEQSMAQPVAFTPILCSAISTAVALYTAFGLLGYAAFGSLCNAVITLNLPEHYWMSTAISVCFSIQVLCAFPVNMYPIWKIFEVLVFGESPRSSTARGIEPRSPFAADPMSHARTSFVLKRTALRSICILGMAVVAWAFRQNFGELMSIIGSCGCATYMFLVPGLIQLRVFDVYTIAGAFAMLEVAVGIAAPLVSIAALFSGSS